MNSVLVFFCAIMVSTMATPNGFYHQEYNYRTSSSSYKNQELQHKNDDEGYYAKDGDLEGRFRPRVNAHSQHSEYVNPKLQHAYRMGTDRTASFGQLNAQDRFQMGDEAFGRSEMGGGYGLGAEQNYGIASDLRQVTTTLQEEMEREVQKAVSDHYQRAAVYGGVINQAQVETDRRILEEELRRNMTMRLQEALKTQYGNQGVRGAFSYSIINGRLQPTANYNNQELEDLRRQLEAHLIRHLDQQVQTYYHTRVDTQVHTQRNTYRQVNGGADTYPSALQQRPMVYPYPQPQLQPIQPRPQPMHPHPVAPVPDSITTVATRVQTELNEILNKILEDTQRRYFAENSYQSGVNYETVLAQLQEELRTNITFHFDDQIKRAYGYSNYASKYSMDDIENLRRQIETNLITKLNRDFNRQREKFFQGRRMYVTQPVIPANQVYYPVHNMNHQRDITEMQRQLQDQMSRQLQTALMQHSYRQAHMYTNSGTQVNPQAQYQATLDQLTTELNRNLTRQMELLNVQYQGQMQSGGYGSQLAQMRNQLQSDLMRQLQQGLQQSYSRYSSWSSSSSSSSGNNANYRPVRGFGHAHNGVYGGSSDVMGEDCMMGDDPSVYQQQDDLTQQAETLDHDLTQQTQTHDDLTQQLEDQDLTQQVQTHDDLTQQLEDQDLTQQVQTHDDLTQQVEDQHLAQQVQTHDDLAQQVQTHDDLTQQIQTHDDLTQQDQQDADLTHQVQTHDDLAQQSQDDADLTQQVQTHDDLTQQVQTHDDLTQQVQTHDDLTQQVQRNLPPQQGQQPQIYRQSPYSRPLFSQNQNIDWTQSQSQDLSQQTHDDITQQQQFQNLENQRPQQVQFHRQPLTQQSQSLQYPVIEPAYTSRTVNQVYSHQPPRQELTPVDQPQQNQYIEQAPVRNQGYRTQYLDSQPLSQQSQDLNASYQRQQILRQTTPDVYQQRRYQAIRNEPPSQYTSTYQWRPQVRNPPGPRVNQAVQYYENLGSRQSPQSQQILTAPKVVSPYTQRQQTDGSNLVQSQDILGQQTENDDLTQQIQGQQTIDITQQQALNQQSQDLTQQTQDTEFAPLQFGNNIRPHEKENSYYRRYSQSQRPSQTQILSQQSQNADLNHHNQYTNQPNQDAHDLTQQTEDLTQTQDLTQQNQGLTQQIQDLNQSHEGLTQQSQDLTQQSLDHDLTQQTEDLGQQVEDFTGQTQQVQTHQNQNVRPSNQYVDQETQDLTQQTEDLTANQNQQQNQDLRLPNHRPQNMIEQDLTQQTEDLNPHLHDFSQQSQTLAHQNQDLRQPNQDQDLTQQTEDLTPQFEDLTQQNQNLRQPSQYQSQENQDLSQQSQDLSQQTQDLTQQNEEIYPTIQPQLATNKLSQDHRNQKLAQQTQDLIQQEIGQNQQFYDEPSPTVNSQNAQQSVDIITEPTNRQNMYDAERESQRLIDLLKNQNRQQQHNYVPMQYSPQPVYNSHNGYPAQVDTTRQQTPTNVYEQESIKPQDNPETTYSNVNQLKQGPGGRSLISPPNQVHYATVEEPGKIETTRDIEPVEPQVANKVQQVGEAEAPIEPSNPEVNTAKPPGWWSRLGQSIKNKIG